MKKIPTAEEYLEKNNGLWVDDLSGEKFADYVSPKQLVEFAELHVRAALRRASNKCTLKSSLTTFRASSTNSYRHTIVDKKSIINAYPKENIK